MKSLSTEQMSMIEAGGFWSVFKCALGLALIAGGVVGALTGVGAVASAGAVGGGAALVNSNCKDEE